MGYHRAGFTEIVGVDHKHQKHYPFEFVQADALEYLAEYGYLFDLIHTSPPCQKFSEATPMAHRDKHPDLIKPTRKLLQEIGKPYVIENVENARSELVNTVKLCGTMFNLPIWRHRYFETWPFWFMSPASCRHRQGWTEASINGEMRRVQIPILATGGGDGKRSKRKAHRPRQPVAEIRWGMEINWMTQQELSEAIPPAYTEWLGKQILRALNNA